MNPTPYVQAGLGDVLPWLVFVFMIIGAISNVIKERKAAEEIKQRSRRAGKPAQDELSREIEAFLSETAGDASVAPATDDAAARQQREEEEAVAQRRLLEQEQRRQQRERERREKRDAVQRQQKAQQRASRSADVEELTVDDFEPASPPPPRKSGRSAVGGVTPSRVSERRLGSSVEKRHLEKQVEKRHLDSSIHDQSLGVGTVAPVQTASSSTDASSIAGEIAAMMGDPGDIRRAILLSEILAKPRSLQR